MLLFQTSREMIFYFQHFIQVCFYFVGKKTGGARAPPAPPLATALDAIFIKTSREAKVGGTSNQVICDQLMHNYLVIHLLE